MSRYNELVKVERFTLGAFPESEKRSDGRYMIPSTPHPEITDKRGPSLLVGIEEGDFIVTVRNGHGYFYQLVMKETADLIARQIEHEKS